MTTDSAPEQSTREISPSSIKVGPIPFSLYTYGVDGDLEMFCEAGMEITQEHLSLLDETKIQLHIYYSEYEQYSAYTVDNIKDIVSSPDISQEEKTQIVHTAGKKMVSNLLAQPRSGGRIEESGEFADSLVTLITGASKIQEDLFMISNSDTYLLPHSMDTSTLCVLVGSRLYGAENKEVLTDLAFGGLLHDIGMTSLSPALVNKTSKLTHNELMTIRRHPMHSYDLIKVHEQLSPAVKAMALQHHERVDGTGYPQRLKFDQIHPYARILNVVDVYDALTSPRPYRKAMPHMEAIELMCRNQHEFDAEPLRALLMIVLVNPKLVDYYLGKHLSSSGMAQKSTEAFIFPLLGEYDK